ncbi:MAG: hypothetical protein QOJ64_1320 [Acidobacteriota bacterium]|jgi:hypothetical protein|nr:hypothetical protein [Acidobacteriota bacterium]
MSANATDTNTQTSAPAQAPSAESSAPRRITNAQTVCNVKNEKGKLCNGHLKQLRTGGEEAEVHLRGDDVLYKCQSCGTLYMGPPLGHLRDPYKQERFVEMELSELLQAAGGTLPAIIKNEQGAFVLAEVAAPHAPASAAAKPAVASATKASPAAKTGEEAAPIKAAAPAISAAAASLGPIPGADGPVPGETFEQKLVRLRGVIAEAKRRSELVGGAGGAAAGAKPAGQTRPTAASTSGTDSSPQADAHRPAAEAQAATGQASAAPLSPAAATASPVAGPESAEDLAPDTVVAATPAAPARRASASGKLHRADYDTGPVPGETFEQKVERLQGVVAAVRERAGG